MTERMWQGPRKCLQHGTKIPRFFQTWLPDRVSNVLLMMPALRVLSGDIEPNRLWFRPGPAYGTTHCKWIEGAKVRVCFLTCKIKQFDQERSANPTGNSYPFLIPSIDVVNEFMPA